MKTTTCILVLLLALCPLLAEGQEPSNDTGSNIELSGFLITSMTYQDDPDPTDVVLDHLWLVANWTSKRGRFSCMGIAAIDGPPKLLHALNCSWKPRAKYVSKAVFGRHYPKFGLAMNDRRDRTLLFDFPPMTAPLAAQGDGLGAEFRFGDFEFTASAIAGLRIGGNVKRGCCDIYVRGRYNWKHLYFGASWRGGPIEARGADLQWKQELTSGRFLDLSVEIISSESVSEWSIAAAYDLTQRIQWTTAFDHIRDGERSVTGGPTFRFFPKKDDWRGEFRINWVFSETTKDKGIIQLILRW